MAPSPRPVPVPPEIIDAFREVAPTVERFAREHQLLIERYRRGKPAWELRFAREVGGEAVITLSYRERTGHVLDLNATWWLDDHDARTRRLRSDKVAVYERRARPGVLRGQLEEALRRIDAWTVDDLGPPRGPFPTWTGASSEPTLTRR